MIKTTRISHNSKITITYEYIPYMYMSLLQSPFSPIAIFPPYLDRREEMAIQQIFSLEKWLCSHIPPLVYRGIMGIQQFSPKKIMLGYQSEVITSKGCINVKNNMQQIIRDPPHSGKRSILIALSVRSKHIRVRFITLQPVISLFYSRWMKLCMIVNYYQKVCRISYSCLSS